METPPRLEKDRPDIFKRGLTTSLAGKKEVSQNLNYREDLQALSTNFSESESNPLVLLDRSCAQHFQYKEGRNAIPAGYRQLVPRGNYITYITYSRIDSSKSSRTLKASESHDFWKIDKLEMRNLLNFFISWD